MNKWQVKKKFSKYIIRINSINIACQVGKNGLIPKHLKREGDLCTPIGTWKIRSLYYREDKVSLINTSLKRKIKTYKINKYTGWCDDINSIFYNKKLKIFGNKKKIIPHHEKLWRSDDVYDIFLVLGYNDNPIIKGRGSAIFLHCSFKNNTSTAGCLAIDKNSFKYVLRHLNKNTYINIS